MATPVYCRGCNQTHDPLLPCPKVIAQAHKRSSKIVFERDRAEYNAYQRDYKKAVKLGLTVQAYRARKDAR